MRAGFQLRGALSPTRVRQEAGNPWGTRVNHKLGDQRRETATRKGFCLGHVLIVVGNSPSGTSDTRALHAR